MWIRSIRKEIVRFTRPGFSSFVQGFQVTRRSGIKGINFRVVSVRLHFIDVFDQLVQILEPDPGIGELEVRAHGHDDVVRGIVSCLVFGSSDEVPNLGVLVIVVKPKLELLLVSTEPHFFNALDDRDS